MLLVGLTGSIGMGKSTTANMFKKYGYGVYNADDAVHYIYENDQKTIDQIEEKFPGSKKNNKVDRGELRNILTRDPKRFKDLENIIHPVTRLYQINYIKGCVDESLFGCILDIPLLFETKGEKYVDVTLLISASEGTQRKRILKDRKLPINVFERIKDQQLPDKDKREKADHIISTDQSIEETMQEVKIMVDKFKKIKPKAWVEHYSK
ncbi:MAG: dephospho-CoA kinase [Candidatus Pelagibacterales bacterium]|jgi:dephospho-CoA kinase|tara:strand:+ start:5954 stop:6577 length:624 start_codon:yes stop_codon:yes gene_type:complete